MCGIGGWIGGRDDNALARMRGALRHRGPDDRGEYVSDDATLFHERLSIIDVAGGRQPMSNEDGRLQIVLNGEIYNYRDLRDRLIAMTPLGVTLVGVDEKTGLLGQDSQWQVIGAGGVTLLQAGQQTQYASGEMVPLYG